MPRAQFLGVTPHHIIEYGLADAIHPLTESDIKRAIDAIDNDPIFQRPSAVTCRHRAPDWEGYLSSSTRSDKAESIRRHNRAGLPLGSTEFEKYWRNKPAKPSHPNDPVQNPPRLIKYTVPGISRN